MPTNFLSKEDRALLITRVGILKKRKVNSQEVKAVVTPVQPPPPTKAPLRSILTNSTSASLPTPPASSSSVSPPGKKRKREDEGVSTLSSKKVKQSHEHSNIEESGNNKRKRTQEAIDLDTTTPRKKPNTTTSSKPQTRPILLPKPLGQPTLRIPAQINDAPAPALVPSLTTAQPPKPSLYTPTNPPPNTKFAGLRWNTQTKIWDSRFIPLPIPQETDAPITFHHRDPRYPGGLDPAAARDATNLRSVELPFDPSIDMRGRKRLAEMEETEATEVVARQWEWEIDGAEEEEVVEGKAEKEGDRESPEARLDAEKAEMLRARRARRSS
ncbi:hypothetical protein FKW77_006588 [Venturia effusa]|uniref:Uncharacterized protein n=1 Tax=Venturia effusa TaxID=50376 RepID=A0A517KZM0_9PEZI|nr:hypothetical protein FKW77_006588 [Venturia effusa]